jgi:hypothetical protein
MHAGARPATNPTELPNETRRHPVTHHRGSHGGPDSTSFRAAQTVGRIPTAWPSAPSARSNASVGERIAYPVERLAFAAKPRWHRTTALSPSLYERSRGRVLGGAELVAPRGTPRRSRQQQGSGGRRNNGSLEPRNRRTGGDEHLPRRSPLLKTPNDDRRRCSAPQLEHAMPANKTSTSPQGRDHAPRRGHRGRPLGTRGARRHPPRRHLGQRRLLPSLVPGSRRANPRPPRRAARRRAVARGRPTLTARAFSGAERQARACTAANAVHPCPLPRSTVRQRARPRGRPGHRDDIHRTTVAECGTREPGRQKVLAARLTAAPRSPGAHAPRRRR